MKLTPIFTLCLPLLFVPAIVDASDVFDELDAEVQHFEHPDTDKIKTEYTQFVTDYLNEYDQWRRAYLAEFDKKQAKIIAKWGEDDVANKQRNVQYSQDLISKTVIDYQRNEAVVEVVVDSDLSDQQAIRVIRNKMALLAHDNSVNISKVAQSVEVIKPEDVSVESINYSNTAKKAAEEVIEQQTVAYMQEADKHVDNLLAQNPQVSAQVVEQALVKKKIQLQQEANTRLAALSSDYKQLRSKQVNSSAVAQKAVTPVAKKRIKYKIALQPNSLAKRAKKFSPFAEKDSQTFDVDAALIMAIIHSESGFDPKAKSPIPAYGLMQIVPRTAGHDVNRLVRHIDKPMQARELYIPNVNVETGAAYLSILDKRYLKSISNPQSRLYCTIAAYNTGAGNVAKVFNKRGQGNTRNIKKAALIINQLSPDEVYDALIKRLPYDETKHYLKKVSSRIALYKVSA